MMNTLSRMCEKSVNRYTPLLTGEAARASEPTAQWPEDEVARQGARAGETPLILELEEQYERAKTDPIDAAVIARFAAAVRPEIRPLRDADTARLAGKRPDLVEAAADPSAPRAAAV